ncbi:MAG: hypothetical protein VX379_02415 [Pseudomonadota bacterium]|nr:hypothetical protein [Pseudomonadota bacterium]MEE3319580.1 hypothetical protein [Pseudomonadota bacterium]
MKHAFNKGVLSSKMAVSLVSGGLLFAAGQAWALTEAGTDIKNKATVTYEDANGNSYSAQSNEAVVTVAEVYAGTLRNDGNKAGAPGETVYFSHSLKNTGNARDTFVLSGRDGGATGAVTYDVYLDANGNGQPDAGENIVTQVDLDPDQQVELILAVPVPSGTAAGTTIDATLLAQSTQGDGVYAAADGGLVQDIGTNGDAGTYDADGDGNADGNDTNNDQVTVTTDAVLVTTKSASVDTVNNTITYTLTVKNNGGRAATDVNIFDAVPANATFVDITSVNGLLAANGDTYEDNTGTDQSIPADATTLYAPGSLATIDEPAGVDLDGDGTTGETGIPGVLLTDASLGVNTTVSIVYQVSFDPTAPAGTEIKNTFAAQGNLDNDAGTTEDAVTSNTVTTVIGQTYAVDANDTEDATDGTDDDIYTVASAASGAVVDFKHTITNNGNGVDVFELSAANDATNPFPAGTTFTFWNAAGTVQITDTNGDGNPDTGELDPAEALNITVKADLPASASGAGPYQFNLTATSAGDNAQSDTTAGVLSTINAAAVDIANTANATGMGDSAVDADANTGTPTTTNTAAAGAVTAFNLYVANESGNAQSYTLGGTVPAGWSVQFVDVGVDTDGNGTVDNTSNAGDVVTATPNLPAGAVYHYTANVTVSSNVAQARADYTGGDAVNTNDSDGDYPVTFTVTSPSDSNINDSKLDAVDVVANRDLSITPDGANQVQPGGNVDYPHVLSNDGNSTETVELSATNSEAGFTNTTQLFVDTNNDGTPDAYRELSQLAGLATAGQLWVRDQAGNPVQIGVADADSDNLPELTLEAGEKVEVLVTVFAPATASQGTQDTLSLSATNEDGTAGAAASATANDVTEVILGQVRLNKLAGVDADCSCNAGTPDWTPDTPFAATQTTQVEPGQCVIWDLTATNEGAATARNVTINDETTPYTTFLAAKDSVRNSDSNTVANSGTAPVVEWVIGDLAAGDSANAQFCVQVN